MMATEFGSTVQRLRQLAGMTLFEVAQKMDISTAFLSAVENGRKRVPEDFVVKLAAALPKAKEKVDQLESLASQARGQVILPLPRATAQDADLATALARKFNSLSPSQKKRIKAILDNNTP